MKILEIPLMIYVYLFTKIKEKYLGKKDFLFTCPSEIEDELNTIGIKGSKIIQIDMNKDGSISFISNIKNQNYIDQATRAFKNTQLSKKLHIDPDLIFKGTIVFILPKDIRSLVEESKYYFM